MSLAFTADTHVVTHAPLGSLTSMTLFAYVRPSTIDTTSRRIADEDSTSFLVLNTGGNNNLLQCFIPYSTTSAAARSSANWMSTGAWQAVAMTFDGVVAPKLWRGTPSQDMAEPPSYITSNAPVGTRTPNTASNLSIGLRPATTQAFRGEIGLIAAWNRPLTQSELRAFQRDLRARGSGCILFAPYFRVGAGPAFDYSGQSSHGVVTGAANSDEFPAALLAWHASQRRRRAA